MCARIILLRYLQLAGVMAHAAPVRGMYYVGAIQCYSVIKVPGSVFGHRRVVGHNVEGGGMLYLFLVSGQIKSSLA